nr:GNAT family N-acetyltransferase [Vibrio palustris]
MQLSDYDAVMALWSEAEGLSLKDADSKEHIARYLAHNPRLSYVAWQSTILVGAVLVGTDGRRGYLQHLAVHSHYRGQGIARQLIDRSLNQLAEQGIAKTHLFVLNDNTQAQHFYEKLGWFARDEVRMYSFNRSENDNV